MSNENTTNTRTDLPLGLGFSLAMNQDAMSKFSNLSDNEKRQVIESARNIQSKQQMEQFVHSLKEL